MEVESGMKRHERCIAQLKVGDRIQAEVIAAWLAIVMMERLTVVVDGIIC